MRNLFYIAFISLGLLACNNSTDDPKQIEEETTQKKMEITKLETEIHELEKKLASRGSNLTRGKILVSTREMEPQKFIHYLDVVGNVETDLEAFVSPEINGIIEDILVKEGDFVKEGQVLANIDTEMINKSIDEVSTQLQLAKTVYEKQKELWDQNIGSEIQYLQAKTNMESLQKKLESLQTQLRKAAIRAPFDGYVESVFQKMGEIGNPARQMFHLVNLNHLKVSSDISETHLPYIRKGDTAEIRFSIFPELVLREPISVIGNVINPSNRTFEIQIHIPNNKNKLKPNIIATIKLVDHAYDSALVVPSIIVKNDAEGSTYVYVAEEKNGALIAQKRFVKAGQSYGNRTMITDGLQPGDKIIIQGYNLVKNGSLIRLK